jgi:4-amino-4-deoxy-L-arabinose transferase-like glycosyltransferase
VFCFGVDRWLFVAQNRDEAMSNPQSPIRTSLLVAGGVIVALSEWIAQDRSVDWRRSSSTWLMIFGALFLLIPLISIIRKYEKPTPPERAIKRIAEWFHLSDWQIVLLFVSPFLSCIAFIAAGDGGLMMNPAAAILAWILAIGAAILGSWSGSLRKIGVTKRAGSRPRVKHESAKKSTRLATPRKNEIRPLAVLLPTLLMIIAFILRAVATDRIPIVLTGDEGSSGIAAVGFIKGEVNNPFISYWYSFPSLYFFIQSLSIRAFGQTTQALRLLSAFVGALTVTATYFTARILFDRRTALVAAIFLAAFNFHINFSRIGLNNIWDGLWYTIVIGALWYGWEREEIKAFMVAGLCLGIAQYFYPSGRTLLMPIAAWLLLMALVNKEKLKRILPGIVIMLLIGISVVLPLGIFYIKHPDEFMAPFNRVTLFGPILDTMVQSTNQPVWLILLMQVVKGLGAFTYVPLIMWYQPGIPLLLPLPATLFLLGLLILLLRNPKERFPLLALWIITFGLIGGLSESTPAAQRYIAAAPVCALLVGYGLSETFGLFEQLWPKATRPFYGVMIAIALFLAANELYFYFLVYTPKTVKDWSHTNNVIAQRLADYLKGKPSDLEVVFFGQPVMGYGSIPSLQYLVPDIQGVDATIPWDPQTTPDIQGKKHLMFVFLPSNESAIQAVETQYPAGNLQKEIASDGKPLYWYYEYQGP